MKKGLTSILDELKEAQIEGMFDLQQDWNEEKELMAFQLQTLSQAIGLLELLVLNPNSQFFKSSMSI